MLSRSSLALVGISMTWKSCLALTTNTTGQWWREPFGMFQTNLREIDAGMDVEATAAFIEAHGASAWLTSVGGILANYPTDLDFQIVNPMLADARASGDLIQDTIDAAAPRGIHVLGRMDFSKVQLPVAEAHPDWLYISPNGTWQNHTHDLVSVCPSGEWYQERVFDIMEEVIDRYDMDGFFMNWVGMNENDYFRQYHGVCHCDACQARWSEYAGEDVELPDGPWNETYTDWKTFSDGIIQEWTDKMRGFIAERLPDAGLILGEAADLRFHESNFAIDRDFWAVATSETASRHASQRPEVPVLINSAAFLDHAYRMATVGPQHFVQFHLQAISRGARPSTYIIGVPGQIPWPGMEESGMVMRFYRDNKDVYAGLKPSSKTGLVLPQSRQFENETQYDLADAEFKGLYKILQELHVPFDVIGHENLPDMTENGGFERYQVIILPHLGEMKTEDAEALDEWASSGGTLLTTGNVGLTGDGDELQLKSLPAVRQIEYFGEIEETWSEYFAPEQNRTEEHYYEGPLIPLIGSYGLYEWKDDATTKYKKLATAPFAPPEYIYGQVQVDEAGVAVAPYGDGKGAMIPFLPGGGFRQTGLVPFKEFIALALEEAGGTGEPFEFNLAPQVEVTVNTNAKGQTVVHLINMSGVGYQNFGAYLPIPAGSIKLTGGGEGVTARTLFTDLTLEVEDGVIQLPGIDLFDVVVIDGL